MELVEIVSFSYENLFFNVLGSQFSSTLPIVFFKLLLKRGPGMHSLKFLRIWEGFEDPIGAPVGFSFQNVEDLFEG